MFSWFEQRINAYPEEKPSIFKRQLLTFMWQCTQGMRLWIVGMAVFSAAIAAFEALLFSLLGRVVDWLSLTTPQTLWQDHQADLAVLAAIIIASPLLVAVQTLIKHQVLAGAFPMRLRWRFHRYLLSQSMAFYQDEFAGRVATKVMQTALAVRDATMATMDILVFIIIYFVTMTAVVGGFNLYLLLPFGLWLTAYILAVLFFVPRLAKVGAKQADARSLMTGRITDAYTNITTVKLFSHAQRETSYVKSAMQEFMITVHAQMRLVSVYYVVNYLLSALLITSTAGIALWLWSNELVGIGAVAAASALALRLNGIAQWVMWEMSMLFENIGTIHDGIRTLSQPLLIEDKESAQELNVPKGKIEFRNVDFSYNNEKHILKAFNLDIKAGEKIGLIGRSGAGKSTLVNLLLRFYEINQGEILIDGQNIEDVTQNSLRAHIGMVTQDTSLLHRSVQENIAYGRPDADSESVIDAAKRAQAHEFILQLRDIHGNIAYQAQVGERGIKLSGGQRQRIAIARVMLKNAPILILDEATSALDSEVEIAIQDSLYELMEGKTVLAIAHRLSTIAAMDRLIVLDQGRIIEQGTHQELLELNGVYASLWAHQSGGFLANQ